jgi:hypothetical protein
MGARPNETGFCPHCRIFVRFEFVELRRVNGNFGQQDRIFYSTQSNHRLYVDAAGCPACGRAILTARAIGKPEGADEPIDVPLWPDAVTRPVPPEVESDAPGLANDFREAVSVLPRSKKASAALSRRCLQFVLLNKGGVTEKDLAKQIDQVLPSLPSSLAANVDAIRHVGNFAAHPLKSHSSGEIVDVEEGEAEWLLDVLEELFDFYYVAPAQATAKRAALNAKLAGLGKPPLK